MAELARRRENLPEEVLAEYMPDLNKAENKPGHKPISGYTLPRWASTPYQPDIRMFLMSEDYKGMAADGLWNMDGWNVAHVAAFHNDLKMLSLATLEECKQPTKFGMTPAHMCGMGHHYDGGGSLNVLYELMKMGACDPDAENFEGKTPWAVAQRMQTKKSLTKWEQVMYKGKVPDNHEAKKEAALRLRGKFARVGGVSIGATSTLPVGLVFPGQGSQYVGMMKDLQDIPEVQDMLKTARSILGYDILEIMLYGPEEKLAQTKYCQPAMYISGLAAVEKLKQDNPDIVEQCQAMAGLSLGEYTALTVAGVFSFEVGLKLVKARAEAMEHETTKPDAVKQGMLSVAGLEEEVVDGICKELSTGGQIVQIANYLFPKGFSCAGDADAVQELEKRAMDAGALQAKLLKTSGAFHTPIMALARDKLLAALAEAKPSMKPPSKTVYMNVTSKPTSSSTSVDEIIAMLGDQLTSAVRWDGSMRNAIEDGVEEFYECGPSKQLKAMMKRIDPAVVAKMTNVLA